MWKRQVELTSRHQKVLDVVNRKFVCPDEPEATAITKEKITFESKKKSFYKNDALAQLLLVRNMNDANVELTAMCDTAKETYHLCVRVESMNR